jgi:hypothetical protein
MHRARFIHWDDGDTFCEHPAFTYKSILATLDDTYRALIDPTKRNDERGHDADHHAAGVLEADR